MSMQPKPRPTFLQSLRDLRESLRQLWRAILCGQWNDAPCEVGPNDCQLICFEVDQGYDESLTRLYRVLAANRTATKADVLWQLPQVGSMHHKMNAVVSSVRIVQQLPRVWDCFVTYSPCDCDQFHR